MAKLIVEKEYFSIHTCPGYIFAPRLISLFFQNIISWQLQVLWDGKMASGEKVRLLWTDMCTVTPSCITGPYLSNPPIVLTPFSDYDNANGNDNALDRHVLSRHNLVMCNRSNFHLIQILWKCQWYSERRRFISWWKLKSPGWHSENFWSSKQCIGKSFFLQTQFWQQ